VKTRNLVCFLAVLFSFASVSPANMAIKNFKLVKEKEGEAGCWNVISSPNVGTHTNNLNAVTGSGNDVWAVGAYNTGDLAWQTLIMHWNGGAWSVVPSPNPGAFLNLLEGVSGSGNDVWAVGLYTNSQTGPDHTLTLHWNGSTWSQVASPNPGANSDLYAVTGSGNDVWAVGLYISGSGFLQTLTLHWNGSTWSVVPSPNVGTQDNRLIGVSGSGDDVWAVGFYGPFIPSQTLTAPLERERVVRGAKP
jgi:hypothetical protein